MKDQSFAPNNPTTTTKSHKKGYTAVPNWILDEILPNLTGREIKIYLYICRRTIGWHKEWEQLKLSDFTKGTGLAKSSVSIILHQLADKDLIWIQGIREDGKRPPRWYALNNVFCWWAADPASMPYSEYLRSPEWQERRKEHLKAAGYACQFCNANHTELHVHHRTYENLGHEEFTDLIVLCKNCHAKFHDKDGD